MKEQKRHIDDFFREELGNFAETPPASAWDALEKKLDQPQPGKATPWFSWWLLLLIPAIMGVTAAIYNWQKSNPYHVSPATQQDTRTTGTTQNPVATNTEATAATIPDNTSDARTSETPDKAADNTTIATTPEQNTNQEATEPIAKSTYTEPAGNTTVRPNQEIDNDKSRIQVQTEDGKGGDNTRALAQRASEKPSATNKIPYGRLNTQTAGSEYNSDPVNKAQVGPAKSGMRVTASGTTTAKASAPPENNSGQAPTDEIALEGSSQAIAVSGAHATQESVAATAQQNAAAEKTGKKPKLKFIGDEPSKSKHTAGRQTVATKTATGLNKPVAPAKTMGAADNNNNNNNTKAAEVTGSATTGNKAQLKPAATANTAANQTSNTGKQGPANNKTQNIQPAASSATAAGGKPKNAATAANAPTTQPGKDGTKKPKADKVNKNKVQETKTATTTTIAPKQIAKAPAIPANTRVSNVEAARRNPRLFNPRYVDTIASNQAAKARKDSMLAAKAREDSAAAAITATSNPPKTPYKSFLSGGIKVGYEQGLKSYTAGKPIVGAYVQYHLSDKLAISMDPALKFARANSSNTKPYGNYYDETSMDVVKQYVGGGRANFVYTQTFDSVIVTTSTPRSYLEIEFPVTLQYKLSRHFELSGGLNFVFGKLINLNPEITRLSGYTLTETLTGLPDSVVQPPAPAQFSHPGSTPFSSYAYPAQSANSALRAGYILGLNYHFDDKIALGFVMQQSVWSSNSIPNADIKSLFTQPYYRVYLGYQLFRTNKKKPALPALP